MPRARLTTGHEDGALRRRSSVAGRESVVTGRPGVRGVLAASPHGIRPGLEQGREVNTGFGVGGPRLQQLWVLWPLTQRLG